MSSNVTLLCPKCKQPMTVKKTKFEQVFTVKGEGFMYVGDTTVETERVVCGNPACNHALTLRAVVKLKPVEGVQEIDTGGGAYIGGKVSTNGGDFVGRDKKVQITTTFYNKADE